MTPEAQRIAIAEACGWAHAPTWEMVRTAVHAVWRRGDELRITAELPDYLNDLNAMHEAEKVLKTDQPISAYDTHLCTVVMRDWEVSGLLLFSMDWHATAAQRAEAFLKTIGKWEAP